MSYRIISGLVFLLTAACAPLTWSSVPPTSAHVPPAGTPVVPCVIWGDSIAVGVSWHAPKDCAVNARVWATTMAFAKAVTPIQTQYAVISLGSNDGGRTSPMDLEIIRENLWAIQVTWILPQNYDQPRHLIIDLAIRYNDQVLDLRNLGSNDGVHPASYAQVTRLLHFE